MLLAATSNVGLPSLASSDLIELVYPVHIDEDIYRSHNDLSRNEDDDWERVSGEQGRVEV